MIPFERFSLDNGLKVIVNTDTTTSLVAMNILYDVGARDEHPEHTGFAHLFEHLMFGGSINISKFDEPLEKTGGTNNAFTNNDITNYYLTIPSENIETAFWLESDRMLSLAFSKKSLDVQRSVVIEEFRQRYLNEPYGDIWHKLRKMTYKVHPYQWPTIGKEISHIQNATMKDVKDFFKKYYCPANAILVLSGDISVEKAKELCNKWFAPIPSGTKHFRKLPQEPLQTKLRQLTVKANVPVDAVYLAFHNCARTDDDYYANDLLSDILSLGKSSRFYKKLVKEDKLFTELSAYLSADIDKGLFVVSGKVVIGVDSRKAVEAVFKELELIKSTFVSDDELLKVKNKSESRIAFSELNVQSKAMNLAYSELISKAEDLNNEALKYDEVTKEEIKKVAQKVFLKKNCSVLYYLAKK